MHCRGVIFEWELPSLVVRISVSHLKIKVRIRVCEKSLMFEQWLLNEQMLIRIRNKKKENVIKEKETETTDFLSNLYL